jgi:membrane protein DedA with SNARE-associated domain
MKAAEAMPLAKFLPAAAAGNLAVAFAWSLAGAVGARADAMQWVLLAALAIPVAAALAVVPGRAAGR